MHFGYAADPSLVDGEQVEEKLDEHVYPIVLAGLLALVLFIMMLLLLLLVTVALFFFTFEPTGFSLAIT